MTDPTAVPPLLSFGSAGPSDQDWYFLDLSAWLPAGDTPSSPVVTISYSGFTDSNPMTVLTAASIDTGNRTFRMPSGVDYVSLGPRIMVKLGGGSIGNTFMVNFAWSDSQGRQLVRQRQILIAAK